MVRRLIVTAVSLCALAFTAAPALAAALEKPEALAPTEVKAESATLQGTLSPHIPGEVGSTYEFRYKADAVCTGGSATTPVASIMGLEAEPVSEPVAALKPGREYAVCLVVHNKAKTEEVISAPVTFKTAIPPEPPVTTSPVKTFTATTATFEGVLNPGAARTEAPPVSGEEAPRVASTEAMVEAQIDPAGLPVTYRVDEEGKTFTTLPSTTSSSALPDERVNELVSPPDEGEPYKPPDPIGEARLAPAFMGFLPFRVAANGDAVAWVGEPASSVGNGEIGPGLGNDWLSARTPAGWRSSDTTPTDSAETIFQAFSPNLTSAIVEGGGSGPPLASQVPQGCDALYSRDSESGAFSALFTAENCGKPLFAGATEDESQLIFQDEAALTPNALQATETFPNYLGEGHHAPEERGRPCMFVCNLYDFDSGQLRLVNVLPGTEGKQGETVPNATFGGYVGPEQLTTFSHAISGDGSRIFWTDTQPEKNGKPNPDMEHIYVLENGRETVQVSGAGAAQYWTATPDGRYAYYTENGELWRFDTSTEEPEAEPHKVLASKGINGENAEVQGVIGVNETGEDGSYVYFVANGVLSNTANAHGDHAVAGGCPGSGSESEPFASCNLYLLHGHTTTFIATLAASDNDISTFSGGGREDSGDWVANVGEHIVQVTPDGRHLVFQSNAATHWLSQQGRLHRRWHRPFRRRRMAAGGVRILS